MSNNDSQLNIVDKLYDVAVKLENVSTRLDNIKIPKQPCEFHNELRDEFDTHKADFEAFRDKYNKRWYITLGVIAAASFSGNGLWAFLARYLI